MGINSQHGGAVGAFMGRYGHGIRANGQATHGDAMAAAIRLGNGFSTAADGVFALLFK